MPIDVPVHRYPGARTLVILHDEQLRAFVDTWKQAAAAKVRLPQTQDPSYQSHEHLLRHVIAAARSYMTWMCECLKLPKPEIESVPQPQELRSNLDRYIEHLLERWRTPLVDVPESAFEHPTYQSRWNVHYCIDAMLEHAVMHPIRHRFQLQNLLRS